MKWYGVLLKRVFQVRQLTVAKIFYSKDKGIGKGKRLSVTVSSLRVDAVAARGLAISRRCVSSYSTVQ